MDGLHEQHLIRASSELQTAIPTTLRQKRKLQYFNASDYIVSIVGALYKSAIIISLLRLQLRSDTVRIIRLPRKNISLNNFRLHVCSLLSFFLFCLQSLFSLTIKFNKCLSSS